MPTPLTGISSMATRALLADLVAAWHAQGGAAVAIESVGGVDAARRVQAGEAFDLVVLAADAIDKLLAAGHAVPGSRVDLVRSGVAVAVRERAPLPDITSEAALQQSLLAARSIGYSTGPSGTALLALFERWGLAEQLKGRLVQARPGVPVATLVAGGEAEIGVQQLSELLNVPGIRIVGPLPEPIQITTVFAGAVCSASAQRDAARALLDFWAAPGTAATKRRHGMEPA